MKKWIVLPLALVLPSMAIFAGCTKGENKGDPASSPNSAVQETENPKPGELPLSKEVAKLKIATPDNYYSPKSYAQNLPVWQEIEKRTNVKIDWNVFPSSQERTVLDTMFAAGSNLPDIANGSLDTRKLYKAGLIHDLKPFIEQFAPNIKKLFAEMPFVEALLTEPTGEILSIPIISMSGDYLPALLLREDWLQKVGKTFPTTIDEFVDVLKAFRDNDPNGDGQKNEIPLASAPGLLDKLSSSFDIHPGFYFYPDSNGQIEFVPITEKYRTYLKFLRMLYDEKLLDPSFASQTDDKFMSMVNGNMVGATPNWIGNMRNWGIEKWGGVVFPKGPDDTSYIERIPPISGSAVITKESKNPQLAMKLLDYLLASDDGKMLSNYGLEGVTYKLENGKPILFDTVLKPTTDNPDPVRAIGGYWSLPRIQLKETVDQAQPEKAQKLNNEMQKYLVDPYPATLVPMTNEETDAFMKGWSDMLTYAEEFKIKAIMGKADLDKEWDSYVSKMKELGIQKKIELEQGKYKRYEAIVKKNK